MPSLSPSLSDLLAALDETEAQASRRPSALADVLAWALHEFDVDPTGVTGMAWASVDVERALEEAGAAGFDDAPRDAVLGASAKVRRISGISLVVAEPDTEGRLAARLARAGEGLCAAYIEMTTPDGPLRPTALDRAGRVRAGSGRWGPFVIELASVR